MTHYVYNGTCPSKAAFDVYQLYIKTADGYCRDELQEEDDGTYTIFTQLDFDDWIEYHYDLRFHKMNGRIEKSLFKTAKEIFLEKTSEGYFISEHPLVDDSAASVSDDEDLDDCEDCDDDLLCYEDLN